MNKHDLLALVAPTVKKVEVDGKSFYVRSLRAADRLRISAAAKENAESEMVLVLLGLAKEDGSRLLSDEDLEIVKNLPLEIFVPLHREILSVSGLLAEDGEDAKKK